MRVPCPRCLRPPGFCFCAELPVIASRTRVVLLQHPREARLAICSARLTRAALGNSELIRGVVFEEDPRVRALVSVPGARLLFPAEGAVAAESLAGSPPPVLFVVDGTWIQAEKMLAVNPSVAALPRVAVFPAEPSGYGALRREPKEGHLSTAEAVAFCLGAFEGDPLRFEPLVRAFRAGVARQLECATGDSRRPRHRAGWKGG